jgi:CheY-like chemotaxis protein
VLDDDPDTRYLTGHRLQRAFPGARILESTTSDEAISAANGATLAGVITDHHLGTLEGRGIIKRLRDMGVTCPVVMVTASSDPAVMRRAYEAGAAKVFSGTDMDFISYFRSVLPPS